MSSSNLDNFLALAGEDSDDDDSFITCKENTTINKTVNDSYLSNLNDDSFVTCKDNTTINWAGNNSYSLASTTADSLESIPEEEDEEHRLTLTEKEARDICNLPQRKSASNADDATVDSIESADDLTQVNDDSDNDDLYEKKELNSSGKSIMKLLQETENQRSRFAFSLPTSASTKDKPKSKSSTPVLGIDRKSDKSDTVAPSAFDSYFGFRLKNPKVSSLAFDSLVEGLKKIKLMQLHLNKETKDDFVTMGVIVSKGEVKKSANGNEYLIWQLHDLKNCQDKPVKLLLFGDACKDYWKVQAGVVVALICPQFGDQQTGSQSKTDLLTLKISKKSQMVELGLSTSYGHCKSICQNGQKCTNFVNLDTSEYCVYHVMSEARKLSSKRGVFNHVSAVQPKKASYIPRLAEQKGIMMNRPLYRTGTTLIPTNLNAAGTMKAATGQTTKPLEGKTLTKAEEQEQLKKIMADRSALPGARNLQLLEMNKTKGVEKSKSVEELGSMANFIQKQEKNSIIGRAPKLGFGLSGGSITLAKGTGAKDAQNAAARLRAISILKNKENDSGKRGLKRRSDSTQNEVVPKQSRGLISTKSKEEIEKLLKRKSLHDNEANKEELAAEDRYFNTMGAKEKVESFTTECMSIKNAKVVTCKKCNYTAAKQSEFCMQQGHLIQKHTAEKRFFKCGGCSRRTAAYGLMPTKPCETCENSEWHRVSMKDERKVVLDNEKLQLRGEERKNVNT